MKEADENDFGAGVEKELDKEAMVSDNIQVVNYPNKLVISEI